MSFPDLNILHIEDDHMDANLVEEMINESKGGQIINLSHVDSIKTALPELSKKQYNVVLLDLMLGDVSGVQNIKMLQDQSPETAIIVLTGMEGDELARQALRLGAQEFLVKAYENAHALKYAIYSAIERKEYERQLYRKANYDSLTDLPNYRFLIEELEIEVSKAKRWKKQLVFMFLDIYRFKEVNDTLGHETGNIVIQEFARRLKSSLRDSDFVARYGGDEFAVILDINEACVKTGCASVASKLIKAMQEPIKANGSEIIVSSNIGFSIFPQNGESAKDILDSADSAMYRAKHMGANTYKFA